MVSRPVQFINAPRPMNDTDGPIVNEERLEQLANASVPIMVHWSGMTRSPDKPVHPLKVFDGIEPMFSGRTTLLRLEQPEKQPSPRFCKDEGITNSPLKLEQLAKAFSSMDSKVFGKMKEERLSQLKKATRFMEVNESGSVTEVKDEQFQKVASLMVVIPLGRTTDSNAVSSINTLEPMKITELGISTEVSSVH